MHSMNWVSLDSPLYSASGKVLARAAQIESLVYRYCGKCNPLQAVATLVEKFDWEKFEITGQPVEPT